MLWYNFKNNFWTHWFELWLTDPMFWPSWWLVQVYQHCSIEMIKKELELLEWKKMYGSGGRWLRFFVQFKLFPTTPFCNKSVQNRSFCTPANNNTNNNSIVTDERYRQLENLDMMTAAKILFTDPPKKKKFGYLCSLLLSFYSLSLNYFCLWCK